MRWTDRWVWRWFQGLRTRWEHRPVWMLGQRALRSIRQRNRLRQCWESEQLLVHGAMLLIVVALLM